MPFGEVKLIPGINVERTPTLLETGYSQAQLIRFKDGLAQKYGGWSKYYSFAVSGVPRDLHAWQDLNGTDRLLVGSTLQLGMIFSSSLTDITPQQRISSTAVVDFTTTANSTSVTIADTNIANVTVFDSINLLTPVSAGGIVLQGVYQIQTVVGTTSYTIFSSVAASASTTSGGAVPIFTVTSGSPTVSVALATSNIAAATTVVFEVATTVGGITIDGNYRANTGGTNSFTIIGSLAASASATAAMNAGSPYIVYDITIGPQAAGAGYGTGGYGEGGYGTGVVGAAQTGTTITATDWTSDNWGQIALACPSEGGVYQYDPTAGYQNAGLVPTAPIYNGGIFVSTTLQMLFCWGSSIKRALGTQRDPMLIRWSDVGDYTVFTTLTTNQAGSYRIPIGSEIRGGLPVANQNLFWTDLDLWAASYAGYPLVFGFNKIGAGAGAISSHAIQQLRGGIFWMNESNFYAYTGDGVRVIPCPIWDIVFQNLNLTYKQNVRAMPNTGFNEAGWLYPSTASSSGECDSYVKLNITEEGQPWDYGSIARSAWIDQSILGTPISATPTGVIYSQETTTDADGQPMTASFTTGYFYIAEGEEFAFVDQIIPDMKWGTYGGSSGAQVYITINAINYPGDTPTTYGPFLMTSTTTYITTRIRARQLSFTFQSSDTGSFWRIGKVRYRWSSAGRR